MEQQVLVESSGGVATVTLNRPTRRNALGMQMRDDLAKAIAIVRDDEDVKAVILTGAGSSFCSGGDLLGMPDSEPGMVRRERVRRLHRWFSELVNLEKPVIAAVRGAAFGAGLNLALAADFVIASSDATFSAAFGRLGLIPDLGGMYLLPRILGLQRAKELVFSTRVLSATEARELGMVYRVVPADDLMPQARLLAERFTHASTAAIGMAKSIMNQAFHLDAHAMAEFEAFAQAAARETSYHREAISRFAEKKPPMFGWDEP
ncbi:MAG TPA: enoyl-CoA hydratase/isomerase family protein [Burkholderiaceae bacterium]|nr:enoyl-CoA hydratase/isomerase family protein [Burkholderiaceae bacterium]